MRPAVQMQDEQLMAAIEAGAAGAGGQDPPSQLAEKAALDGDGSDEEKDESDEDESDEDEQLMAAIVDEEEQLIPTGEMRAQDEDLLVAAARAVAPPIPPALLFDRDLQAKDPDRAVLDRAPAVALQQIGVERPGRRCREFVADVLETTADEHRRRHQAYTRARITGSGRWAAIRGARFGSLLVLPGLWCLMGLLAATLAHSGGSSTIVGAVWGAAGLVALLLVSLRGWRAKAAVVGARPVSADVPAGRRQDPKLAFSTLWVLTWVYAVLLFLIPATAMVEMNDMGAQAGAYLFLFALWFAGWGHHWFSRVQTPEVEDIAMMSSIPDGLTFRLRAVAVIYEGYTACGFSFFPSLPWKKTSVPMPVVHFFEAASFEFGVDAYLISFLMACATVPVAFAALVTAKRWGGAEQFLMVVDLFFESLMFPVCKQLIGVLTCTRGDLRETTTEVVVGNTTTFTTKRVCGHTVPFDASCMDGRPDVECWSDVHLWYVLAVFLFLVPYFVGGAQLRTEAQKQTSTVVIDGLFSILAFQIKFLLAVISSGFGGCHPWLVLIAAEASIVVMLIVTARRNFSNVLQLTALRVGGLTAAALNGFVAAYVAWRIAPDSCAELDNAVYAIDKMLPDDYGTRRVIVVVEEVRNSGGDVVSSSTTPTGAQPLHEIDASSRNQVDLTQDLSDFIALVSVNAFVLLAGIAWYYRASAKLTMQWEAIEEAERIRLNQRVDYPIVRKRLLRLPIKAKTHIRASMKATISRQAGSMAKLANVMSEKDTLSQSDETTNGFMMCVSERLAGTRLTARAAGKQLEDLTIELLLFKNTRKTMFLNRDPRVFFFDLDVRTTGCERLMRHLKSVLEDALTHDVGCLNRIHRCGCIGRQQLVANRTVGVQFAAKPLGLANSRRWAENVEERLCFLGQVPRLNLIDLRGTSYDLELLALGACDPVDRSNFTPATLSYVVAGTSIRASGASINRLPADLSGKSMGYDVIPQTVESIPSSLDTLVVDFMNPSDRSPAVIGTRNKAHRSARTFAQIYSEFCDLFAEGCLQWRVDVSSKLTVFTRLNQTTQLTKAANLSEWIAQILGVEKDIVVDPKYVKQDRSASSIHRVRWSLCFQVRQQKMRRAKVWNSIDSFESAAVLSNFIKGFLQSRAIRKDHRAASATKIASAWRELMRRRNRKGERKYSHEARPRRMSLHGAAISTAAVISAQHALQVQPAMVTNREEDAAQEQERDLRIRSREFSRTDKLKALRQMVARRVPGAAIGSQQFEKFEKSAGEVIDLTFTCIDVRSKGLGPWHVALVAAWASHHPQVTELLLGHNRCIGQDGKSDLHLDPWCRTVKRLATDANIRNLDLYSVGMGPAGLLVLTQGGLLRQLTALNLGSNPIIGDGKYEEKQLIARISEQAQHRESADVWGMFCEALCCSNIASLNLRNTGLVPQSLSTFSNSLYRNAELIAKQGTLTTMILANNDLTAAGDVSGLAIFLVSASCVARLDISATGLGPSCAEAIANELSELHNLTSLNIAGNNIGVDGAALMAHKMQQHSQDLNLLLIGDASKPTPIPVSQTISDKLDWSAKGLGPADAVLFSALLPTVTVAKIDLRGNELGYVGKAAVATAMRHWGLHGECPIEQLRIDLGNTASPGATIKISQTAVKLDSRDLSLQDLLLVAGFLARQPEVDALDLSDNVNLFEPQEGDVEYWDTMRKALHRATTGKKHNYHLCQPLYATNQASLWTDHDLQSWLAYTKQLLGDAEEEIRTGCRRLATLGEDVVQHAWWRLCQAIRTSTSSITDLRLSNIGLTAAHLVMLADGFEGGSYLQREMQIIDLHKNGDLTGPKFSEQPDGLNEFLSKFGKIEELNVSSCGLGDSDAKTIGNHLHKISLLNIVNNSSIGVKGATFIAERVTTTDEKYCTVRLRLPGADDGSSYTRLSLFSSYYGADSKRHTNRNLASLGLADASIRLQQVKLGFERVGTSVVEVCSIPFYQKDVQKLSLARAGLRDADAVIVAASLSTLRNLGELDVQGNSLGPEGKAALARVIQDMDSLHTLVINIGDHQPVVHQSSTSEDDDDIIYPELRRNTKPKNPCFVFGGESQRTRGRDQIDLSHMELRAEDLLIVAAWVRAPLAQVSELNLSHNESMLCNESTRDASGRNLPVLRSFVHQAWSSLCTAVRGSNIRKFVLQNVGLSIEEEGKEQWCINPLAQVLERTASLRQLDISHNFLLRDPCGEYFDPSDEEKLERQHALVAKKAIAQAMIQRSEGWLPYSPLETGDMPPPEASAEGTTAGKHFALSSIAEAMARLQQGSETDQQTVEYKRVSKPAYKPLQDLTLDLGTPSSKQNLATAYKTLYKQNVGNVYDVEPSQAISLRRCSLRGDDAILLSALVTVWDNTRAVNTVRSDVADNMLGQSGRMLLIDAFTRGPRSTFTANARLVIDVGQWEKRGQKKQSVSLTLDVPVASRTIKWDKGFGQKQLALLSAWLREAVAHKKSRVYEINLSLNPHLGGWDLKEALLDLIIARHKRQNRNRLSRMTLCDLNAIVYDQNDLDAEEIEARIVEYVPQLKQISPHLRHGLDKALMMLSQCAASARKVEVLKLNGSGLTPARLMALSEAIKPHSSTGQGFAKLRELHLNDNRSLLPVAGARISKDQPWDRLCQAIAHTAHHHQLTFVSFSGCRLHDECVAVLATHLLRDEMGSKSRSKNRQRLFTLDVSNNETLSYKGGKYLADALVVRDHNWPVVEIVVGHIDRAFLAKQQSIKAKRVDTKSSKGVPRSDSEMDEEAERELSNTLPLEKQRQIEQQALFRPLVDDDVRLTQGRVLDLECKGLSPGLAWIVGEWLATRDKMFRASEYADMAICCLKLQGNPLTGSSFSSSSTMLSSEHASHSQQPLCPGSAVSWTEAGGVIDTDPLGFGKLCEAFGLPNITDVDISYCGLGAQAMREMTKSEHNVDNAPWLRHAQLRSLNLSHNPIGVEGREYLRKALCDADIQRLTVDIGGQPKVLDAARAKLSFSQSELKLTAEDAIVLAGWITVAPVKTNLVEMDISDNDLFSVDCNGFADLMEAVPTTNILTLKMARIGLNPAGALCVAEMIERCASLRDPKDRLLSTLSLSGNAFAVDQGQKALRALCTAIGKSTIGTLDLSDMKLTADQVDSFLRPAFERIKPSQIKQVVILGNDACYSDRVMTKLVAVNTALQSKLFYKDEHKLTLNDTSQTTSRYLSWMVQQSPKTLKEDTQLKADSFGKEFPANPYEMKSRQLANRMRQQKHAHKQQPQLSRSKSGPGASLKTGSKVMALGKTLSARADGSTHAQITGEPNPASSKLRATKSKPQSLR